MYSKEDEVYYRDSFINEWLIFKDDNADLLLEKFYTEPNPDELYENIKNIKRILIWMTLEINMYLVLMLVKMNIVMYRMILFIMRYNKIERVIIHYMKMRMLN